MTYSSCLHDISITSPPPPQSGQKKLSHGSRHSTKSQIDTKLLWGIRKDCNIHQCSSRLPSTTKCAMSDRTSSVCAWRVETGDPELLGYWHIISQGWKQAVHFKGKGAGKKGTRNAWPEVSGQGISQLGDNFKRQVLIMRTCAKTFAHTLPPYRLVLIPINFLNSAHHISAQAHLLK